jgi:hypothetical protein
VRVDAGVESGLGRGLEAPAKEGAVKAVLLIEAILTVPTLFTLTHLIDTRARGC